MHGDATLDKAIGETGVNLRFRQAAETDLPAICAVIDASYAPLVHRLYGDSRRGRWAPYDPARVRASLDREAAGVRVGEWQGAIVAVCVCRSYGSLGWFHSLGIHPEAQGRGFGKQAVADAEAYLSGRGVRSIGLMTWPDAIDNIAFYQRLGYDAAGFSLYTYRQTHSAIAGGRPPVQARMLSSLTGAETTAALTAAACLANQVLPGLDYTAWLIWTVESKVGDTLLVWRSDSLLALALASGRPDGDWLEGRLLAISPEATPSEIAWTLEYVRRWSLNHRFGSFGFPADVMAPGVARLCGEHGFRFYGDTMLNLTRGPWPPVGIHLLRFGG